MVDACLTLFVVERICRDEFEVIRALILGEER